MLAAEKLFLPGWGASKNLYSRGLPGDWIQLDPPTFVRNRGSFDACRRWILDELDLRPGAVELAGHSMGAALAIAAAAARPDRVKRLVLISPAGLPLAKPILASLGVFVAQTAKGLYPAGAVARSVGSTLRAPRSALRLARTVHDADLSDEMALVRQAGVPAIVIGCTTDTLVTTAHSRRVACLLGASYRELELEGGHMWMLSAWPLLARELAA